MSALQGWEQRQCRWHGFGDTGTRTVTLRNSPGKVVGSGSSSGSGIDTNGSDVVIATIDTNDSDVVITSIDMTE
jgi:hypothetical protein